MVYLGSQRVARAVVSCDATVSGYSARFSGVLDRDVLGSCEMVLLAGCEEAVVEVAPEEEERWKEWYRLCFGLSLVHR